MALAVLGLRVAAPAGRTAMVKIVNIVRTGLGRAASASVHKEFVDMLREGLVACSSQRQKKVAMATRNMTCRHDSSLGAVRGMTVVCSVVIDLLKLWGAVPLAPLAETVVAMLREVPEG